MAISVTLVSLGMPNSSTPTPTFSALVGDPINQVKARFYIYQSDGSTLIGTVDSEYITGEGIVSAQFNTALPIGTYQVRAKAMSSVGEVSAFTSLLIFYVTTPSSKDVNLLWDALSFVTAVSTDFTIFWDSVENEAKQLKMYWTTDANVIKDLDMRWNVNLYWDDVEENETIWVRVAE